MDTHVTPLKGAAVWWATARDVDPALLSGTVRERLAAMRAADDRRRHATGALLGDVVVRTHGGHGARVERVRGEAPRVEGTGGALHLSVAHTGHLVVVAAAPWPVGVDVELDDADADAVVAALSSREHEMISGLPGHRRREVLLRTWVRKEAVLKALGTGLARDPRTVEFESPDGSPALSGRTAVADAATVVRDLVARPGTIAALAVLGGDVDEVEEHDGDILLDVAAA